MAILDRDRLKMIRKAMNVVLIECEETGKFRFNSRYFYSVGEEEIAFQGIFRFVEGNQKFKEKVSENYAILKSDLLEFIDPIKDPIFHWDERD